VRLLKLTITRPRSARRFHDTILAIGSVPLSGVQEHIARVILRAGGRGQTGTLDIFYA
jgi:hypothetical protein